MLPVEADAPVGGGAAVQAAPSPRGHGPERPQPVRQPPSPSALGPHTALPAAAAAAVVALGVVAAAAAAVRGGGGGGGGGGLGGGAVRGALLVHLAVLLLDLWGNKNRLCSKTCGIDKKLR